MNSKLKTSKTISRLTAVLLSVLILCTAIAVPALATEEAELTTQKQILGEDAPLYHSFDKATNGYGADTSAVSTVSNTPAEGEPQISVTKTIEASEFENLFLINMSVTVSNANLSTFESKSPDAWVVTEVLNDLFGAFIEREDLNSDSKAIFWTEGDGYALKWSLARDIENAVITDSEGNAVSHEELDADGEYNFTFNLMCETILATFLEGYVPGEYYITSNQTYLTYPTALSESGFEELAFVAPAVKGFAGSLEFTKVAYHDGKPLEGAEFELYDIFDECIATAVSGKDGKVVFDNIPSGSYYYVSESAAPEGYETDWDVYFFEMLFAETVFDFEFEEDIDYIFEDDALVLGDVESIAKAANVDLNDEMIIDEEDEYIIDEDEDFEDYVPLFDTEKMVWKNMLDEGYASFVIDVVWEDAPPSDLSSISVDIYAKGYDEPFEENLFITKSRRWLKEIDYMPVLDANTGNPYEYYVAANAVDGYDVKVSTVAYDADLEEYVATITFSLKKENPSSSDAPSESSTSSDPSSTCPLPSSTCPTGTSISTSGKGNADTPKTSDETFAAPFVLLMLVALSGVVVISYKKKNQS